ncbi:MAG: hypothetical protein NNA20_10895 [Nitrospira sp.]|nr:hypothetical protein [Nitrospira sp.]MCP9443089.1 hypothetical protein [Nitrospira sp.]
MKKHLPGLLALLAIAMFSTPADAHRQEKKKHIEPVKAYHGGHAQEAGPYHLELVATDGELVLYVADHDDKAVSTEGGKAKATIQQGYEKTSRIEVELQPAGDNVLKGTGAFTINQNSKVMVFIKLPDHEAHAASFTPLGAKSGDGHRNSATSSHTH